MASTEIQLKSASANRLIDSTGKLGTTLAEQQLSILKDSYHQRYEQGITNFWQTQIHMSEEGGEELAALKLEAQRQFAIKVGRTVLLLGAPCGLVGVWGFGVLVGVSLFVGSVFLGIYFGSK